MAEQIVNEFTVNKPIDEAWPIICDIERIAPCLPGAQLEEIEGEIYRGRVKVKLGAVSTQFKGEAHFVERDDVVHKAKLKAKGRDTGGRGNADADIYAEAESLSPTSTKCTVTADLHITGKVAQFGRGIMGDVSKKLMDQFASNLNTMLDEQGTAPLVEELVEQPVDQPVEAVIDEPVVDETNEAPTVRKINGPAAEPIDMAGMAGPALLKRLGPAVAAILLIMFLLRRRK